MNKNWRKFAYAQHLETCTCRNLQMQETHNDKMRNTGRWTDRQGKQQTGWQISIPFTLDLTAYQLWHAYIYDGMLCCPMGFFLPDRQSIFANRIYLPSSSSFATKNMPTVSIDVFWLQWLLSFVPLLCIRSIRWRIRLFGEARSRNDDIMSEWRVDKAGRLQRVLSWASRVRG